MVLVLRMYRPGRVKVNGQQMWERIEQIGALAPQSPLTGMLTARMVALDRRFEVSPNLVNAGSDHRDLIQVIGSEFLLSCQIQVVVAMQKRHGWIVAARIEPHHGGRYGIGGERLLPSDQYAGRN